MTPSIFQQSPQQSTLIPVVQECIDAITEHQRLLTLMKGEWGKGLLTQGSVRADYTVRRIRELAEGTCVKKYEYLGEVYDSSQKKWSSDLPTDSHLLLYLFCAFLEHPKWMLHVDPTAYAGSQSSKNPLFLGVLPPKERFPEKYVAVVSGVPSVLHPGACVLAVGKQSPPVFALFWDKKPQFSLQGRTAVWDSVLLLCYKIKVGYGGIVRGLHLGSSALDILSVLDPEPED
nr:transmembrane protein 209 [Ipomoea batatas]